VLRPENAGRIDEASTFYRRRDPASSPDAPDAVALRHEGRSCIRTSAHATDSAQRLGMAVLSVVESVSKERG
jgi:hypothetical protein